MFDFSHVSLGVKGGIGEPRGALLHREQTKEAELVLGAGDAFRDGGR